MEDAVGRQQCKCSGRFIVEEEDREMVEALLIFPSNIACG